MNAAEHAQTHLNAAWAVPSAFRDASEWRIKAIGMVCIIALITQEQDTGVAVMVTDHARVSGNLRRCECCVRGKPFRCAAGRHLNVEAGHPM